MIGGPIIFVYSKKEKQKAAIRNLSVFRKIMGINIQSSEHAFRRKQVEIPHISSADIYIWHEVTYSFRFLKPQLKFSVPNEDTLLYSRVILPMFLITDHVMKL
jgi:hypothetical protein